MEEINTGGPAFGQVVELRCVRVDPCGAEEYEPALAQGGMTMRDYFASKALQGMLANAGGPIQANGISGWALVNATHDQVAAEAYAWANAMLKAREAK
ncbi:hypothetical protein HNP33_004185 [Comamonas odontotermitis]|uniref:Uncharacterized protein n=1 Tax=Comamonas odontotermitis TaxID=379895 RepID=A0ABR6RM00_9BURK|nr:hypothetical protein [Comamonas odontotermitis]MBB6580059.1 hypothetical protein [Comamonas odontotermitis]